MPGPVQDAVRFIYFVDTVDTDRPRGDHAYPMREIEYSPTWHLIRRGKPLMGTTEDLLQHPTLQLGMHADWYGFLGQKLKMWLMRLCHRSPLANRLLKRAPSTPSGRLRSGIVNAFRLNAVGRCWWSNSYSGNAPYAFGSKALASMNHGSFRFAYVGGTSGRVDAILIEPEGTARVYHGWSDSRGYGAAAGVR